MAWTIKCERCGILRTEPTEIIVSRLSTLRFVLQSSRPGLWFSTIWLYMLPTAQMENLAASWSFWAGLLYVMLPLNLLVYGWNDIVDRDTDRLNPRKGNFLFGARGSDQQLTLLPRFIVIAQLIFYPVLLWAGGWAMAVLLLAQLGVMALYNHPTRGWRSRPPLELTCQVGYLLVVPFSILLNDGAHLSLWAYIYLSCFAMQSHLMGEVMDIVPDRTTKKYTTATTIGARNTKFIIIALVVIEVVIVTQIFDDWIFGGMLLAGLVWLLVDLFILFRDKQYSLWQMKLFGFGSNAIAFASIAYVWWSGCLS